MPSDSVVEVLLRLKDGVTVPLGTVATSAAKANKKILDDELKAAKQREAAAEALVRKIEAAEAKKRAEAEKTFNLIDRAAKQTPIGGIVGDIDDVGKGLQALPPAAGAAGAALLGIGAAAAGLTALVTIEYELFHALVDVVSQTSANIAAMEKYRNIAGLAVDVTDQQKAAALRLDASWEALTATQTRAVINMTKDATPAITQMVNGFSALTLAADDAVGGDFWQKNWDQFFGQWKLWGQTLVVVDDALGGDHWATATKNANELAAATKRAADEAKTLSLEWKLAALDAAEGFGVFAEGADGEIKADNLLLRSTHDRIVGQIEAQQKLAEAWKKKVDERYDYEQAKMAENFAAHVRYLNEIATLNGRTELGLGGNGVVPNQGSNGVGLMGKNVNSGLTEALTQAIEEAFKADAQTAGSGDKKAGQDPDAAVHKVLGRVQSMFSNGFEGLFSAGAMKGIGGAIGAALDFAPVADEMLQKLPDTLLSTVKLLPDLIAKTIPKFVESMISDVIPALVKAIPEIFKALFEMLKELVIFLGHLLNPFDDKRDKAKSTAGLGGGGGGPSTVTKETSYIEQKKAKARYASGGWAAEPGLYYLHRGERVTPSNGVATAAGRKQAASSDGGSIHLHIHGPVVGGQAGLRELVRELNALLGPRAHNLSWST